MIMYMNIKHINKILKKLMTDKFKGKTLDVRKRKKRFQKYKVNIINPSIIKLYFFINCLMFDKCFIILFKWFFFAV